MTQKFEKMFTPFKINQTEIKNRFVMCAMGGTALIERGFNEKAAPYYIERAKGGVGLIITGISQIKDMWGRPGWLHEDIEKNMDRLKEFMNEIHKYDCKLFLQIGAGMGRCLSITSAMYIPGCDTAEAMNGPSEGLPNVWVPEKTHRALTVDEIHRYIKEFGLCAKLLKEAGFDGVEVHAVHEGYLLDQFAMECSNWRTDEYGGCLENRLRFACEIVKEIKEQAGQDFPVSMRYSVASKMKGFNSGALPEEPYKEFGRSLEESPAVAKMLEEAGYDMLNCDNGTYDSWYWCHPPVYMPLAHNLTDAAFIKNYVHIPVCVAGRMEYLPQTYRAIEMEQVDAIGCARQYLIDPEWPDKVKNGNYEDVKPCIACHNGCFGLFWGAGTRCALNAATMHEDEYPVIPAKVIKNIAVIGGGIGGMECAIQLAKRGHKVDLYEKSNELGGVFIAAAAPEFKEKDRMLIDWYRRQVNEKYDTITLHLNTEVDLNNLSSLSADEYIICTGASPRVMKSDKREMIEAIEYLRGYKEVGQKVTVIGGGLTGCEIAYDLALKGKEVTIVEMMDDIIKVRELAATNRQCLIDLLKLHKVNVITSAKVTSLEKSGLHYEKDGKTYGIKCDSIITSIGYEPNNELKEKYKDVENIHFVGDVQFVGNLKHVVWAATDLAMKL
ncbi:FAD-dependent oxidoreductase [Floccifex sp.]|uniref:oxidoreductase n=1 Tax=Floccifex sp. TaxID=2815810 RepID=UPI003EFFED97